MRVMVLSERQTYCGMLLISRDGRSSPFTRTGTDTTRMPFCPRLRQPQQGGVILLQIVPGGEGALAGGRDSGSAPSARYSACGLTSGSASPPRRQTILPDGFGVAVV